MFLEDKLPHNAISIEYIPNIQPIGLSNFSRHYLDQLRDILHDFHEAGILHGDPQPRNMVVSPGEGDKVL